MRRKFGNVLVLFLILERLSPNCRSETRKRRIQMTRRSPETTSVGPDKTPPAKDLGGRNASSGADVNVSAI